MKIQWISQVIKQDNMLHGFVNENRISAKFTQVRAARCNEDALDMANIYTG